MRFVGLEILTCKQGQAQDKIGRVEFKARYRQGDHPGLIHENSRFKRYQGRWIYWDREIFQS